MAQVDRFWTSEQLPPAPVRAGLDHGGVVLPMLDRHEGRVRVVVEDDVARIAIWIDSRHVAAVEDTVPLQRVEAHLRLHLDERDPQASRVTIPAGTCLLAGTTGEVAGVTTVDVTDAVQTPIGHGWWQVLVVTPFGPIATLVHDRSSGSQQPQWRRCNPRPWRPVDADKP